MRSTGTLSLSSTLPFVLAACVVGDYAKLISVPTQPPTSVGTPSPCPGAITAGKLVAHTVWGIALDDRYTGSVRKVLWPYGFAARDDGDRRLLLNGAGDIVAREGESIQLDGGDLGGDATWLACGDITVLADPSARVHLEPMHGDRVRVVIGAFVSSSILERLAAMEGVLAPQVADWRAMVDAVMIDPAYDGEVFTIAVTDIPERKTDVAAGSYAMELRAGSRLPLAVKITECSARRCWSSWPVAELEAAPVVTPAPA